MPTSLSPSSNWFQMPLCRRMFFLSSIIILFLHWKLFNLYWYEVRPEINRQGFSTGYATNILYYNSYNLILSMLLQRYLISLYNPSWILFINDCRFSLMSPIVPYPASLCFIVVSDGIDLSSAAHTLPCPFWSSPLFTISFHPFTHPGIKHAPHWSCRWMTF